MKEFLYSHMGKFYGLYTVWPFQFLKSFELALSELNAVVRHSNLLSRRICSGMCKKVVGPPVGFSGSHFAEDLSLLNNQVD